MTCGCKNKMPNVIYNGPATETFTVPSRVFEVFIKASGAGSGQPGSFVQGGLNVSPGQTIDVTVGGSNSGQSGGFPNGGDGNSRSISPNTATSDGGAGGTYVRRPDGSTAIAVGGAGGKGAAFATDDDSNSRDIAVSGRGGAGDEDAPDKDVADSLTDSVLDGGLAGAQSGNSGANGPARSDTEDVDNVKIAAVGGGGGGGHRGGGAGNVQLGSNDATATGGGGGTSLVNVDTNGSFNRAGGNTGDGTVEIQFPPAVPEAPSLVSTPPSVTINWTDVNANETEYRIRRKGPSDSSFARIATVGGNTLQFEDTDVSPAESYEYAISAFDDTVSLGSPQSTATAEVYTSGPRVADSAGFVDNRQIFYYNGTSWVPAEVGRFDGSAFDLF
jgi:hypothetical protein